MMTKEDRARMREAIEMGRNTFWRETQCMHGHHERYISGPCVECIVENKRRRRTMSRSGNLDRNSVT